MMDDSGEIFGTSSEDESLPSISGARGIASKCKLAGD